MHKPLIRILLVNEDADQYMMMANLLKEIYHVKYEMTWCARYDHALEAMISSIHDVVLLDYHDNHGACAELLKSAINQGCVAPIICVTEEMDRELDQEAVKAGAADYLVKEQITKDTLERSIRYAIDRKQSEKALARLAHYDPLTGVPNRLLFRDRLERALQRAERAEYPFALLYIDLDGFKKINDSFGHDAGDLLVKGVAERLSTCIRRTDSVARIGGDEFTVLLEKVSSINDIVSIAKKINDIVTEPFDIEGHQVRVGSSIGIAVYPEAGKDADTLLKHADMAMYEAKALRGSTYRFFTEKMNIEAVDQLRLEAELRRALRNDEFDLYFQPRVSFRTQKVVGMEALLRWNHPTQGVVLPGEFIELAEQVGLIVPLGYWVVNKVCEYLVGMDQQQLAPLRVSLNISFRQFHDSHFVETVSNILAKHGIDGKRIEFELTETEIMANVLETGKAIEELSKLGIRFALDDFGTGFSSFSHIQRLPISTIKLDKSYVQEVTNHEDSGNLVRAMINFAHGLKLHVVAEGVETDGQVDFLKKNACDQLQGYYHSMPEPFEVFCKLISDEGATSRRSYLSSAD